MDQNPLDCGVLICYIKQCLINEHCLQEVLPISIAQRKEREKEDMRREIMEAASKIASNEGIGEISVRKIAGMIDYSPGIIYHYFKNKDEIIQTLLEQNYRAILESLSSLKDNLLPPEEMLKKSAVGFLTAAVQMGDLYSSIMLSRSPKILAQTSVLQKGASKERPAIALLCKTLHELPSLSEKSNEQIELTAQIIWSTSFGLATRLIVENVGPEQQKRLIEQTADFLLHAINCSAANC